jgi:hypothetical protein
MNEPKIVRLIPVFAWREFENIGSEEQLLAEIQRRKRRIEAQTGVKDCEIRVEPRRQASDR